MTETPNVEQDSSSAICDDPLSLPVLGDLSHSRGAPGAPPCTAQPPLPPSLRAQTTHRLYPLSCSPFNSPQEAFQQAPGQVRVGHPDEEAGGQVWAGSPFRVPPEALRCSPKPQMLCLGPGFRLSRPGARRPGAGTEIHFLPALSAPVPASHHICFSFPLTKPRSLFLFLKDTPRLSDLLKAPPSLLHLSLPFPPWA